MAQTPSKRWVEEVKLAIPRTAKYLHGDPSVSVIDAATLLSHQHKEFMRLVKKLDEMEFKNMSADFQAGQHNAYMRVLAALQQGGKK